MNFFNAFLDEVTKYKSPAPIESEISVLAIPVNDWVRMSIIRKITVHTILGNSLPLFTRIKGSKNDINIANPLGSSHTDPNLTEIEFSYAKAGSLPVE